MRFVVAEGLVVGVVRCEVESAERGFEVVFRAVWSVRCGGDGLLFG